MTDQSEHTVKDNKKAKRIAIGCCYLLIGVVLAISFFSFFFTWENDQSELLNSGSFEFLFSHADNSDPALQETAPLVIMNKGGRLGALLAKKFIHDWFGIGSFAIVFLCFFFMLRFFDVNVVKQQSAKRYVFVAISLMIICSITLGFFCNDTFDGNLGGCLGYYFSYQFLRSVLGTFVTGLLIIVVDCLYVILTFKKVVPYMQQKISDWKEKRQARLSALQENQEMESGEESEQSDIEIQEEKTNSEVENEGEVIVSETSEESSDDLPKEPVVDDLPQDDDSISEQEFAENENTEGVVELEQIQQQDDVSEPLNEQEEDKNEDDSDDEISLDPNDDVTDEDEPTVEDDEDATHDGAQQDEVEEQQPTSPDSKTENAVDKKDKMTITNKNTAVVDTTNIEMEMQDYDPKADLSKFKQPDISLLKVYPNDEKTVEVDEEEQIGNQNLIEKTLFDFGIEIEKIDATVGATITLYEIVPKAGTKISRIKSLEKDIMMSLSALGIRIIAPIPGKGTVGIEVPNKNRQTVSMYSVINSKVFKESKMELPVALGKTITNDVYMFDLAKMPHLLVAGSTGQGKSVGLNAIVTSLLYKKHPSQLKFVMVDPKMVEFSIYSGLERHYMAQYPGEENIILTDCKKVITTLNSLVEEMEERYKLLMDARCRNIIEYNDKFIHRHLLPSHGHKYLPYIVIIIDEYGDFMMQAGKEIETPIARIAQKARAVGMHLILATQQPSVKIVTSVIKANIPGRIAFRTASNTDSMIILGSPGAEGLVGKGDLLVSYAGNALERVQCAFVDTPEVERIVDFIGNQRGYGEPFQLPEVKDQNQDSGFSGGDSGDKGGGELDSLFEDASRLIVAAGSGSTSAIQRKFQVGYNRAGRLMDQLERYKVVGPYNGSKPREVLTDEMGLEQILNNMRMDGILKGI